MEWLNIVEVSGSYGIGVSAGGQAGSVEGKAGLGTEAETTWGLGGSHDFTLFAGADASAKAGPVEADAKAGITVSSKEGASAGAEVQAGSGPVTTGGGVKFDKHGFDTYTATSAKQDTKVGAHLTLGLGVGVNVNVSQAKRAFNDTMLWFGSIVRSMVPSYPF